MLQALHMLLTTSGDETQASDGPNLIEYNVPTGFAFFVLDCYAEWKQEPH